MKNLFERKDRIKNKSDIDRILKEGQRFDSLTLKIFYIKNQNKSDRLGILVSKKSGNAVKRNSLKRIIRELFRNRRKKSPPFFDVLIKPRHGTDPKRNYKEFENSFEKWKKFVKK